MIYTKFFNTLQLRAGELNFSKLCDRIGLDVQTARNIKSSEKRIMSEVQKFEGDGRLSKQDIVEIAAEVGIVLGDTSWED